jgi:hypothetical protein
MSLPNQTATVNGTQESRELRGPDLYEVPDWALFRQLEGLSQKSGVPPKDLRRLVAKEVVDNAPDACGSCQVGELKDGGFFVQDSGPGIPGSPEEIAQLFSIRRPMLSSKLIRKPLRGALGNGLRVVAGAVLASGGNLVVLTNGMTLRLTPQDSGATAVEAQPWDCGGGTSVMVWLGDSIPPDKNFLSWAKLAIRAAGDGPIYAGNTSCYWYHSASFFELLQAAEQRTVRQVLAEFEGCSRWRAGTFTHGFLGRPAAELTRAEADLLLGQMRVMSRPVNVKRFQLLGRGADFGPHYAVARGTLILEPGLGELAAELPYTLEAWARRPKGEADSITALVNRTPVADDMTIRRGTDKAEVLIFGGNLGNRFNVGRGRVALTINLQIPFMPIVSDGKKPDLERFLDDLRSVIEKAGRSCQRANPTRRNGQKNQKQTILDNLQAAIKQAGGGKHRYRQRQLFYTLNDVATKKGLEAVSWSWFCKVIGEYENQQGADVPGMVRDDRGVVYHPHLGETLSLGTLSVEAYEHPKWLFNKVLYCEKEGFLDVLKADRWPERHDCALLTSKGYPTRAARDLLDLLGDTGEELLFFAIHDGDAYGSCIFEALQEATLARPARRVHIINVGVEPWQGLEMGLHVENVKQKEGKRGKKHKPVGRYIIEKGAQWEDWLQTRRVELNSMSSPQFLGWLDEAMATHGRGKLIPAAEVMHDHLTQKAHALVKEAVRERVLEEAGFPEQVEEACAQCQPDLNKKTRQLRKIVQTALAAEQEQGWRAPIERLAADLVEGRF